MPLSWTGSFQLNYRINSKTFYNKGILVEPFSIQNYYENGDNLEAIFFVTGGFLAFYKKSWCKCIAFKLNL